MTRLSYLSVATMAALATVAACAPSKPPHGGAGPVGVDPLRNGPHVPGPRHALPTCPLRYEVLTLEEMEMTGPERAAYDEAGMTRGRLEAVTEVVATPREGRVLELASQVTARVLTSRHRYAAEPETRWAAPHITTDGLRWTEVDGVHGQARTLVVSKLGLALPDPAFPLLEVSPARVLVAKGWRSASRQGP